MSESGHVVQAKLTHRTIHFAKQQLGIVVALLLLLIVSSLLSPRFLSLPNLLNVTLMSDALGRSVKMRVSANAFKTVDHRGGLDAFLAKAKDSELSPRARDLKRQIAKKNADAKAG